MAGYGHGNTFTLIQNDSHLNNMHQISDYKSPLVWRNNFTKHRWNEKVNVSSVSGNQRQDSVPIPVVSPYIENYCWNCSMECTTCCADCHKAFYCSKRCQNNDWPSHKLFCNKN